MTISQTRRALTAWPRNSYNFRVVGTQLGAYKLLQQIGEGGMGSVWLAEHAMLGRRAAIKVLHPDYTARPDIVSRFFNEARAATAITPMAARTSSWSCSTASHSTSGCGAKACSRFRTRCG
jgi:serine/threonine protein kinase